MYVSALPFPMGTLYISADERAITALSARAPADPGAENDLTRRCADALRAYFGGGVFPAGFPLAPQGTVFQKKVWNALLEIPFGQTCTYSEIASKIGRPAAARAVGAAIGRNPIWLLIPCHRVLGKNGALTGYAGGLELKQYFLDLERGRSHL